MRILIGVIIVGFIMLAGVLSYQGYQQALTGGDDPLTTSYQFEKPRPIIDFVLTNQDDAPFTAKHLLGQWSLIFVGYTSCPDICPTTMAKLSSMYEQLNTIAPVQIIFLSVDPARDSIQKLQDYRNFFHPKMIAVTGEHAKLYPLTQSLGMVYAMTGTGADYQVDHSASLVLINPQGERVAVFKTMANTQGQGDMSSAQIIHDFRLLTKS
ncbi:MAG: SCO family protein [Shewanella sp.]